MMDKKNIEKLKNTRNSVKKQNKRGEIASFYLTNENAKKIKYWKKQNYSPSKIIQHLIDNAPKEFE